MNAPRLKGKVNEGCHKNKYEAGELMKKKLMDDFNELDEDTMKGKFLTFSLGSEFYGIEIQYVTEIVGIQPITEVPELPYFIKGIINLRGRIIPVMDVRTKFKKDEATYNDRTCIIVVDVHEISIGIIVDEVSEVLNIEEENIVPPPRVGGNGRKYIKAIGKNSENVILIIDCEQLLDKEEIEALAISS